MIKVTYEEVGKVSTQQAVMKLANSSFKTPAAFAVKHVTKAVRDGFMKMREEYVKEVEDKYLDKTQTTGGPKEGSKSAELQLPFACKDGMEGDCKGALDSFGKRTITIDKKKITAQVLFEVNEWTPRELESLEFLTEEPA